MPTVQCTCRTAQLQCTEMYVRIHCSKWWSTEDKRSQCWCSVLCYKSTYKYSQMNKQVHVSLNLSYLVSASNLVCYLKIALLRFYFKVPVKFCGSHNFADGRGVVNMLGNCPNYQSLNRLLFCSVILKYLFVIYHRQIILLATVSWYQLFRQDLTSSSYSSKHWWPNILLPIFEAIHHFELIIKCKINHCVWNCHHTAT